MEDNKMEDKVKDHVPAYERPRVVDYGTLVELTRTGGVINADIPGGVNNTAFPPGSH